MSKCKIHGKDGYRVYSVVDGERKYFYGYTLKEAEAKQAEFERKLKARINFEWEKATISHMIDEWLSENKERWELSTYEWYVNMAKHIKRDIGNLKLWNVTARQLNDFLKALAKRNPNTGRPAGKKLVRDVKHILKTSFTWAVSNNYLERNPTEALVLPKMSSTSSKHRCLTMDEIRWVLFTPHKMQTPSVIMLYTGMRPEEVLALKNSDIDLTKGIINVNKAVKYSGNVPYIGETKTGVSRVVVMPPELIEYLKEVGIKSDDKLLVPDSNGKVYHKRNWQRKYKSYITDLDILYGGKFKSKFDPNYTQTIDGWTPYCLRHTSATMGSDKFGVSKKQLADNQGHNEETMTRYYEDSILDERRKEMAKVAYKDMLSKPEIKTPT